MVAAKLANLNSGDNQHQKEGASIDAPQISQPAAAAMLNTNLAPGDHSRMMR